MYKAVLSQLVTCRATPFRLYLNNLLFPEPWIPIPNTKYLFKSLKSNLSPYSIFEVCFCTSWENEQQMSNIEATGERFLATSFLASVTVSGCASPTLASTKDQPQPQPHPPWTVRPKVGTRGRQQQWNYREEGLMKSYESYYHPPMLRVTPSYTVSFVAHRLLWPRQKINPSEPQPPASSALSSVKSAAAAAPGGGGGGGGSGITISRCWNRMNRTYYPPPLLRYMLHLLIQSLVAHRLIWRQQKNGLSQWQPQPLAPSALGSAT